MSSVKPFKDEGRGGRSGGASAFTRGTAATAATSSSEESRRSAGRQISSSASAAGVDRKGRSKSRPRSSATVSGASTSGASSKADKNRGRSYSRPRDPMEHEKNKLREHSRGPGARSKSRGAERSARSKSRCPREQSRGPERSRSRPPKESQDRKERGHSLGPQERRGRSSSRPRELASSLGSASNSRSSRSRSRVSMSLKQSQRESMETMEEEPDDLNSDKVSILEAVSAAAASSRSRASDRSRDKSLPRNRSKSKGRLSSSMPPNSNAAAAAIAAALKEVNRYKESDCAKRDSHTSNAHHGGHKAKASSFHHEPATSHKKKSSSFHHEAPIVHKKKSNSFHVDAPVIHKKKSNSFHLESRPKEPRTHGTRHKEHNSNFIKKSSRSVSPPRHQRPASRRSSLISRKSSTVSNNSESSTFSAYDARIANTFTPTLVGSTIAPSGTSSRKMGRRHSARVGPRPSNEMAIAECDGEAAEDEGCNINGGHALLDKDGCCILHPFIQLKMKLPSGSWRTLSKTCCVCREDEGNNSSHSRNQSISTSKSTTLPQRRSSESLGENKPIQYRRSSDSGAKYMPTIDWSDRSPDECSLTPSFLEEEEDDVSSASSSNKASHDDASSSKSSVNSQVEHKTRNSNSIECASVARSRASRTSNGKIATPSHAALPPREISIADSMISNNDEMSIRSRETIDTSLKGSISSRHSAHTLEQDDTKSIRSSRSNAARTRQDRSIKQNSIDIALVESVVESAMQKIKSNLSINDAHTKAQAAEAPASSRCHPPPPPPPPRSQSSKNLLPHKAQSKPLPSGKHNGSSNNSSLQRPPPPPPPPPRPQMKPVNSVASNIGDKISPPPKSPPPTTCTSIVDYDCSMAVLNPEPEPELQNDFSEQFEEVLPEIEQMEVDNIDGGREFNTPTATKDWMKYCISSTAREGKDSGVKKRIFGRNAGRNTNRDDRGIVRSVKQMPFTDQFGDYGLYTGQVNEDGRPDGKGSMKYDNGVFYEGTWTNGGQDQKAALQYDRIRGGFTSWQGRGQAKTKGGMVLPWNARKNDAVDPNEKTHVRGMEWTDLNGDSGRYTGEVNASELPHGHGIMKYDFGLIAEGEWNNGILKENPQDRMMAAGGAAATVAMGGGRSIAPGMSVGPGAHGFNTGASVLGMGGAASVLGGAASVMGGMPVIPPAYQMPYGAMNPMMLPQPHPGQYAMMAQQNAMMKGPMIYGGGSVYGGSAYGSGAAYGGSGYSQMPPQTPAQHQNGQPAANDGPPISEIKIN